MTKHIYTNFISLGRVYQPYRACKAYLKSISLWKLEKRRSKSTTMLIAAPVTSKINIHISYNHKQELKPLKDSPDKTRSIKPLRKTRASTDSYHSNKYVFLANNAVRKIVAIWKLFQNFKPRIPFRLIDDLMVSILDLQSVKQRKYIVLRRR